RAGGGVDAEDPQIEIVGLVQVDDRRADDVLVPAHRVVHDSVEQERHPHPRQPPGAVAPQRKTQERGDGNEVLRTGPAQRLGERQVRGAQRGNADGEEPRGAAQLLDALAHRQDPHSPRASRRGRSGWMRGSTEDSSGGDASVAARRRSRQASTAGSAKSAAERQVISPMTAVRPKDWIAMLSAVTRVAYPLIVVAVQRLIAHPEALSVSITP